MRRTLAWTTLVLASSSCGGGGPTMSPPASPTPAPTITVMAIDGVSGAVVHVSGPTTAPPGAALQLTAPGYLDRATLLPGSGRVSLWPITVDEAYVRRIVYETWSFSGTQRLFRWERRALGITPGTWMPARAEIESTGAVTLTDSPQPDIEVRVDPGDPDLVDSLGFTRCSATGYTIDHCRVVVRTDSLAASPLLTHELGHCLGLGHSQRGADVMNPRQVETPTFTPDERVLVTMMYGQRRPGNAPPDDDRGLGALGRARVEIAIRD